MAEKYKIPRGTFDILPQDSYKWEYIRKKFRDIAELFNYREIVTPIFEQADLFERSVGNSTDIVQKEMYKFCDKKGRSLALRPEGTASVVRSYVENSSLQQESGTKLFYLGPMFRYDRPQKGRYRQFYQYGVEILGVKDPLADVEVIALGYLFLKDLGLSSFTLEINSIGCSECSPEYDKALVKYFNRFKDSLCNDCLARLEKNPKRILDCKIPSCIDISQEAPSILDNLDEECRLDFDKIQEYLTALSIPFKVNSRIVRGLDYYQKTAFEFINNNLGAQNALLGGGRYDGLVAQLGGKDVPGIGFAGGFERLIISMENEKLSFGKQPIPQIFLILLGETARDSGIKILHDLRKAGISADFLMKPASIKSQMKQADRSRSPLTLILGDNELDQGIITLKNMNTGTQESISLNDLISVIKEKLS